MSNSKTVKSIVVALIIFFTSTVGGISVEVSQKADIDQLTKRALERSPLIKKAEYNIASVEITRDRANLNLDFIPAEQFFSTPEPIIQFRTAMGLTRALENAEDSLKIEVDSLRFDVMKKYQAIINSTNNLELARKNQQISKMNMDIAILKYNFGLASELEKEFAIQSYAFAKNQESQKKNELIKAFEVMNEMVGFLPNDRYDLAMND